MENKYLYILIFFTALLFSCGGGGGDDPGPETPVTPPAVPVTSVSISQSSLTMEVGENKTLTAIVTPLDATNRTVAWRSSNTNVATVSANGEVTAITEGRTVITASADRKSATCEVTVKSNVVHVTSVTISQTYIELKAGETFVLTAVVSPSDATNKTVIWQSSNTSIATVSANGEVKGIGAGNATITATSDGKSATCEVTVSQESGGINVDINDWNNGDDYKGNVD